LQSYAQMVEGTTLQQGHKTQMRLKLFTK